MRTADAGSQGRGWKTNGAGQLGLSLLETLIALGVLGFIGTAFFSGLSTGSKSAAVLNQHVVAEELARSQLEETKNAAYDPAGAYAVTVTPPAGFSVAVGAAPLASGKQKLTVTVARDARILLAVEDYKIDR